MIQLRPTESRYTFPVRVPYRLDLTVSVLRRLSTNLVDVLSPEGEYVRVLDDTGVPVVMRASQATPRTLTIGIEGDRRDHPRLLTLVRRMLGVEVDLSRFYRSASSISWLDPLVHRMQGVRPPRYPTLWEACVNAVVFQQVSLVAASTIMGRLIAVLARTVNREGIHLYPFPSLDRFQDAGDGLLREAGLSAGKLATLRRVGDALGAGALDEARLEQLPSADAGGLLCGIKGIGPWTAAVILLRGLGRLDVFPSNDTSVVRNLMLIGGSAPLDLETVLEALGPDRGMLYYHLLLARLEARGQLAPPPGAALPIDWSRSSAGRRSARHRRAGS
jgi:DNA-3-methyladenine glycosylase II